MHLYRIDRVHPRGAQIVCVRACVRYRKKRVARCEVCARCDANRFGIVLTVGGGDAALGGREACANADRFAGGIFRGCMRAIPRQYKVIRRETIDMQKSQNRQSVSQKCCAIELIEFECEFLFLFIGNTHPSLNLFFKVQPIIYQFYFNRY